MKIKVWSLITPKNDKTLARLKQVEILVETKGNTLEAAVECASWRSAGLDRALKIDRSGKTSQFFAQSSHSRRAHYSKNRPKRPKNGQIFLAPGYRIPGYPALRGAGAPKMMLGYPDRTDPIIPYRVKYRNPEVVAACT